MTSAGIDVTELVAFGCPRAAELIDRSIREAGTDLSSLPEVLAEELAAASDRLRQDAPDTNARTAQQYQELLREGAVGSDGAPPRPGALTRQQQREFEQLAVRDAGAVQRLAFRLARGVFPEWPVAQFFGLRRARLELRVDGVPTSLAVNAVHRFILHQLTRGSTSGEQLLQQSDRVGADIQPEQLWSGIASLHAEGAVEFDGPPPDAEAWLLRLRGAVGHGAEKIQTRCKELLAEGRRQLRESPASSPAATSPAHLPSTAAVVDGLGAILSWRTRMARELALSGTLSSAFELARRRLGGSSEEEGVGVEDFVLALRGASAHELGSTDLSEHLLTVDRAPRTSSNAPWRPDAATEEESVQPSRPRLRAPSTTGSFSLECQSEQEAPIRLVDRRGEVWVVLADAAPMNPLKALPWLPWFFAGLHLRSIAPLEAWHCGDLEVRRRTLLVPPAIPGSQRFGHPVPETDDALELLRFGRALAVNLDDGDLVRVQALPPLETLAPDSDVFDLRSPWSIAELTRWADRRSSLPLTIQRFDASELYELG